MEKFVTVIPEVNQSLELLEIFDPLIAALHMREEMLHLWSKKIKRI